MQTRRKLVKKMTKSSSEAIFQPKNRSRSFKPEPSSKETWELLKLSLIHRSRRSKQPQDSQIFRESIKSVLQLGPSYKSPRPPDRPEKVIRPISHPTEGPSKGFGQNSKKVSHLRDRVPSARAAQNKCHQHVYLDDADDFYFWI